MLLFIITFICIILHFIYLSFKHVFIIVKNGIKILHQHQTSAPLPFSLKVEVCAGARRAVRHSKKVHPAAESVFDVSRRQKLKNSVAADIISSA